MLGYQLELSSNVVCTRQQEKPKLKVVHNGGLEFSLFNKGQDLCREMT